MDVYLILGCNGNRDSDGFLYCSGTENVILDLSKPAFIDHGNLLDFLDDTCRLFDRPEYDYNACINIITMLYRDYECFDEDFLHKLQFYFKNHRACGVYITLMTKEDYENVRQSFFTG